MNFLESYADNVVFLLCAAMIFVPLERILPRVERTAFMRENIRLDVAYALAASVLTMALSALYNAGDRADRGG